MSNQVSVTNSKTKENLETIRKAYLDYLNATDHPSNTGFLASQVGWLLNLIVEQNAEKENLLANSKETGADFSDFIEHIWKAIYPHNELGNWDYPVQVFRHLGERLERDAKTISKLTLDNTRLRDENQTRSD